MIDPFDRERIKSELLILAPMARSAFAAAAATRMLVTFDEIHPHSEDSKVLHSAMDKVWTVIISDSQNRNLQKELELVIAIAKKQSTLDNPFRLYSEDAADTVACAIRSLMFRKVDDAIAAIQRVFESMATFERFKGNIKGNVQEIISQYEKSDLMRQENSREFQDLIDLTAWNPTSVILVQRRAKDDRVLPPLLG